MFMYIVLKKENCLTLSQKLTNIHCETSGWITKKKEVEKLMLRNGILTMICQTSGFLDNQNCFVLKHERVWHFGAREALTHYNQNLVDTLEGAGKTRTLREMWTLETWLIKFQRKRRNLPGAISKILFAKTMTSPCSCHENLSENDVQQRIF